MFVMIIIINMAHYVFVLLELVFLLFTNLNKKRQRRQQKLFDMSSEGLKKEMSGNTAH